MKKKYFLLAVLGIVFSCMSGLHWPHNAEAQYLWQDAQEIARVRQGESSDFYKSSKSMIRWAEKVEKQVIPLLTEKESVPPSGDKRDYTSLAIYYWPDDTKLSGLPYVNHDGKVNPEKNDLSKYDAKRLETIVSQLRALSLGYAVSGREDFAQRACEILDAWFIQPETRMNPNLEYAQLVPGKRTGGPSGIIDTVILIGAVDNLHMLEGSAAYTPERQKEVRQWFHAYADWLRTSKHGQQESAAHNNHGVWYDAQLAVFYHFAGEDERARRILRVVKEKRMEPQMAADGSLPLELARTRPMQYSIYTLRAYLTLARLGEVLGVNLYDVQTKNGSGLQKSIDFILPYARGEKLLPRQDVAEWKADAFFLMLHAANRHYRNPAYEPNAGR